jgi:hypothetical protein
MSCGEGRAGFYIPVGASIMAAIFLRHSSWLDNNFGEGGGGSMDQLVVLKHYQKNSQVKK